MRIPDSRLLSFLLLLTVEVLLAIDMSSLIPKPKAKWTLAVYMNGDNELEPSITGGRSFQQELSGDFVTELAALGSSENVHVVALIDRHPKYAKNEDNWFNTRLYYVEKGDHPNNTGTFWVNSTGNDELNMSDPSSLVWFLYTIKTYFPSDRLLLSMWDHNWGWHPNWFQKDETSDSAMMYSSLYQALGTVSTEIDILVYDACVSSQVEVLHSWFPRVKVFVGSQDYIGWGGVDYGMVVEAIENDSNISSTNLAIVIAESILTDPDDHCASAISLDTGGYSSLVKDVSKLAASFIAHLDSIREVLIEIREDTPQTPSYPADDVHRDLFGIALRVESKLAEYPDSVEAAKGIMNALNSTVFYNRVVGKSCSGGEGVSIYWPKSRDFDPLGDVDDNEYIHLSFAADTMWDDFLQSF